MEEKTYIFEGKTTNEAIENGLKELKVSKNRVEIKVLENEDKRSFFSILAPRVVKVEMKLKNDKDIKEEKTNKKEVRNIDISIEEINNVKEKVEEFLKDFKENLKDDSIKYDIKIENNQILIDIDGNDVGFLIGYRWETLNALQTIITNIANKKGKVKVLVNVAGYRQKREKDLQVLAGKIASSVIKTKKKITLEPMSAFERKIIHTKLQENDKVKTYSIGEEPYRKVVVELK